VKHQRPKYFWNRKYIINPNFQFNLIIPCLVFTFFVFITFYAVNYFYLWKFYCDHGLGAIQNESNIEVILKEYFFALNIFFLSSGILTLVLLITGGIIFTHKVAGPMFRLKRHMLEVASGKTQNQIYFRKSDHFHDIADAYNEQLKYLINR